MTVATQALPAASSMALIAPLLAWSVYRRVRRNVGRQELQPKRLWLRIAVLGAILAGFGWSSGSDPAMLGAMAAGLVAGLAAAWWGLHLTRFEFNATGDFYYPNTWLGLAVSLIFIARIAYRMVLLTSVQGDADALLAASARTPTTLGLLALVVGYYVAYNAGLLRAKSRHAPPA
jgi:hypothetical protein